MTTASPLADYLSDIHDTRRSPAASDELSYYPALHQLLNRLGREMTPAVFCIHQPRGGAGDKPDYALYTTAQMSRDELGNPLPGVRPERGVIEAKPPTADLELIARSAQVQRYWDAYQLVLVTNFRAFLVIGRDQFGRQAYLERFDLTPDADSFWRLAARPQTAPAGLEMRFVEFMKRVLLHNAALTQARDVAWFLASYARESLARLEAHAADETVSYRDRLDLVRTTLEEALGIKFVNERSRHFFRSTLVQTLFYGLFSAWVIWCRKHPDPAARPGFSAQGVAWHLKLPVLRSLFEQVYTPTALGNTGLAEVLEWAANVLRRVDDRAFFARFQEDHAVQYFYEPFLEAYDPGLREQFGVWYTPPEVVHYMVERVDWALRTRMGVPNGLADPRVKVLDPCCGTGSFVLAVLDRIQRTHLAAGDGDLAALKVKEAAITRVNAFEIMPAPFVVAHLQVSLMLERLGAPLREEGSHTSDTAEWPRILLSNALTGFDSRFDKPDHYLPLPELHDEMDRARRIKREEDILVVLGNPPYDAFAEVATGEEERALAERYRRPRGDGIPAPRGHGLNDLYVRFYAMAERRITEQTGCGIVCFITNSSWLNGFSHPALRERFRDAFDAIWIDNLNGDRDSTGKRTPDGRPDPSIFSTRKNPEGIKEGTCIALLVREGGPPDPVTSIHAVPGWERLSTDALDRLEAEINDRRQEAAEIRRNRVAGPAVIRYRDLWGTDKREQLAAGAAHDGDTPYHRIDPTPPLGLVFRNVKAHPAYGTWPQVPDLFRTSSPGVKTSRDHFVVDIEIGSLRERISDYLDEEFSDEEILKKYPSIHGSGFSTVGSSKFDKHRSVRRKVLSLGPNAGEFVRYEYQPFDQRWLFWEDGSGLLDRSRPDLFAAMTGIPDNRALICRPKAERDREGSPFLLVRVLPDWHLTRPGAVAFPERVREGHRRTLFEAEPRVVANLSVRAMDYLRHLDRPDETLVTDHILAIGHAPAYLAENGPAVREGWPRIPMPGTAALLDTSAALGRHVAALLDAGVPVPGVTNGAIRPDLTMLGTLRRTRTDTAIDLGVNGRWGYPGRDGICMPGPGDARPRPFTDSEAAAIAAGAGALGIDPDEAIALLGGSCLDIHLNATTLWSCVPKAVWEMVLGGYQVIKKWLSYREQPLLGRPLTMDEAAHVTTMTRRLATLLLLGPRLDANYRACAGEPALWDREGG
ncbi:MAG: hypothetical protein RLY86_395 [Pseudomonadota bacterium]|jgi:hypothetical protein